MNGTDNGSATIFISLLGMPIDDLFASRLLNKLETLAYDIFDNKTVN